MIMINRCQDIDIKYKYMNLLLNNNILNLVQEFFVYFLIIYVILYNI